MHGNLINETDGGILSEDTRALFVSGSPVGVSAPVLRKLAAQTDFILAVDSGANQLAAANLIPDLLIGDLDSVDQNILAHYKTSGVTIQSFDAYKNATDVELGIRTLEDLGLKKLVATNVLGGRTDHSLGSLAALAGAAQRNLEIVLRDEYELCFFVDSKGKNRTCKLCFEEGSVPSKEKVFLGPLLRPRHISLVSWGGQVVVSFKGVEWELDHHMLSPSSARGVSNLVRKPCVELTAHEGEGVVLVLLSYL